MHFLTYIQQWYDGLLSEQDLHAKLDGLGIRGGIECEHRSDCGYPSVKFCGYDYNRQQWINLEVG